VEGGRTNVRSQLGQGADQSEEPKAKSCDAEEGSGGKPGFAILEFDKVGSRRDFKPHEGMVDFPDFCRVTIDPRDPTWVPADGKGGKTGCSSGDGGLGADGLV